VTSDCSSMTSGTLAKLRNIPSQYDSTPYFPILQLDGTLRPPPISFSGYGSFGGRFVPESIMEFLYELTSVFESAVSDPAFWAEYASFQRARNTPLHLASKLTDLAGGASIWLKREDLNEYGSHKTRNIIGQLSCRNCPILVFLVYCPFRFLLVLSFFVCNNHRGPKLPLACVHCSSPSPLFSPSFAILLRQVEARAGDS
jgi:hypothetical protein